MASNSSALLRDLLVTTKDGDWGKDQPLEGHVPFKVIRGADFPEVRVGDYSTVPLCYLNESTVFRRRLEPSDILIETAGGNRDRPTGRTILVTDRALSQLGTDTTCASFCRFLRVNRQLAEPRYVYWYLQYLYSQGVMWNHQVQHTGIARFQYTKFAESTEVPLPTRKQQESIADILSTLDDKIELNRRTNETLEAMAKALFKSWFVDFDPVREKAAGRQPAGLDADTAKLFPSSFEDSSLGPIPKGWRVIPLPNTIEVNPTRSLSKGVVAPYLEMSNMPTASVRAVGWENREFGSGMRFINGDTLIARITPCLENGKTAFVDFLEDDQVGWGSTEYIVLRSKAPLPTAYTYFLARSDDFRAHVIRNMTGTSGRQRAPAECLNAYCVVVPDAPIAGCFGEFADDCIRQIKSNDDEARTLATTRDSLLPKLFSGELSVSNQHYPVAST
jgi:type I restriction enzyme, S subunit